jgi:hypothetical protein
VLVNAFNELAEIRLPLHGRIAKQEVLGLKDRFQPASHWGNHAGHAYGVLTLGEVVLRGSIRSTECAVRVLRDAELSAERLEAIGYLLGSCWVSLRGIGVGGLWLEFLGSL